MRKKKTTTQQKKKRLRSRADMLWYQACIKKHGGACELCGKTHQLQVHHYYPKGSYGHLRYKLSNGIILCKGCHFRLHHADATIQDLIRDKRGQKWYIQLKSLSQQRLESYEKISYYEFHIKKLTDYLGENAHDI